MQKDYVKLVDFMKTLQPYSQVQEAIHSPPRKDDLIPKTPTPLQTCTLEFPGGKSCELPILEGNEGPMSVDARSLHQKVGYYTFDPGFTSTASCISAITYIDGEEGKLWYRGYSIDELAEKCSFLEVCFILLYGELPSKTQLLTFETKV
mmetsp:Transcript_40747/g.39348  ORF Transcript_40747/g.39348 Transcript_40747/m.39348 type:complete len:149 (-) Transcript_40747:1031-1477(-)